MTVLLEFLEWKRNAFVKPVYNLLKAENVPTTKRGVARKTGLNYDTMYSLLRKLEPGDKSAPGLDQKVRDAIFQAKKDA